MIGGFAGVAALVGVDFLITHLVDGYLNWSKYREPIFYMPVIRNGKPWYTSLYGLTHNTEWEAIQGKKKEVFTKAKFFWEYFKDEFETVMPDDAESITSQTLRKRTDWFIETTKEKAAETGVKAADLILDTL